VNRKATSYKLDVTLIESPTKNVPPHWCRIVNILDVVYLSKFLFETTFRRIHLSPSSGKKPILLGPVDRAGPEIETIPFDWTQLSISFTWRWRQCPISETSSQKITSINDVQEIGHSLGKLWTSAGRKWVLRGRLWFTEILHEVLGINYSCPHSSLCRRTCLKEIWCRKYFAELFILFTSTYSYPGCWMI
jgi:hypothetical protein